MHTLIPHTGETDRQVDLWVLGYPVIHSQSLSQKTDTYIRTHRQTRGGGEERERERKGEENFFF